MKNVLIGFSEFKSKKGNLCKTINLVRDYTDREKQWGSFGSVAESFFLPEECFAKVDSSWIGKEVMMDYQVSGGKAYLQDIILVG